MGEAGEGLKKLATKVTRPVEHVKEARKKVADVKLFGKENLRVGELVTNLLQEGGAGFAIKIGAKKLLGTTGAPAVAASALGGALNGARREYVRRTVVKDRESDKFQSVLRTREQNSADPSYKTFLNQVRTDFTNTYQNGDGQKVSADSSAYERYRVAKQTFEKSFIDNSVARLGASQGITLSGEPEAQARTAAKKEYDDFMEVTKRDRRVALKEKWLSKDVYKITGHDAKKIGIAAGRGAILGAAGATIFPEVLHAAGNLLKHAGVEINVGDLIHVGADAVKNTANAVRHPIEISTGIDAAKGVANAARSHIQIPHGANPEEQLRNLANAVKEHKPTLNGLHIPHPEIPHIPKPSSLPGVEGIRQAVGSLGNHKPTLEGLRGAARSLGSHKPTLEGLHHAKDKVGEYIPQNLPGEHGLKNAAGALKSSVEPHIPRLPHIPVVGGIRGAADAAKSHLEIPRPHMPHVPAAEGLKNTVDHAVEWPKPMLNWFDDLHKRMLANIPQNLPGEHGLKNAAGALKSSVEPHIPRLPHIPVVGGIKSAVEGHRPTADFMKGIHDTVAKHAPHGLGGHEAPGKAAAPLHPSEGAGTYHDEAVSTFSQPETPSVPLENAVNNFAVTPDVHDIVGNALSNNDLSQISPDQLHSMVGQVDFGHISVPEGGNLWQSLKFPVHEGWINYNGVAQSDVARQMVSQWHPEWNTPGDVDLNSLTDQQKFILMGVFNSNSAVDYWNGSFRTLFNLSLQK